MSPAASVDGVAAILAMGTATPPNTISQADFPDMYFRAIDSDHVPPKLKSKFRRICESSMIESRNVHMTEEVIKENKDALGFDSPSLSMRQKITKTEIPKLGKEASEKAINEWGRPASDITHLVMTTNAGIDMPSADYHLTKLLGLRPSVKRVMIHQPGCHGGVMVLRLAKDLAENNKGARVLAVCVELVTMGIRGMNKTNLSTMLQQILFGEGASAAIVGSQPVPTIERPIFELVSTAQTIIPDSDGVITGNLCEAGIIVSLGEDISKLIANNLEACLTEAFSPLNISDWNSIFWIAHPGGRSILDNIEAKLGLKQEKLMSTRKTLKDYGNISTASVLFVLEETRRKSLENKQATTGEGLDWGVILGFGPGLTIETIVLRSVPFPKSKVCEY